MGLPNGRGLAKVVDRVIPGPGSVLDTASQRIQRSIKRIQDNGPGRLLVKTLRGDDWLGHPAHPIAVTVPIGAWVTAAFFDLRSLPGGRPVDEHAADTALRLGVLGAAPAAAMGWAQFLTTTGGARRQTVVHAALVNAGLLLNVSSLAARASGHRRAGRQLSCVALAVVGISGFLGGDLAYRLGVGVHRGGYQVEGPDPVTPADPGDSGDLSFEERIAPSRRQ
jgi:uncharacterized membrane protein